MDVIQIFKNAAFFAVCGILGYSIGRIFAMLYVLMGVVKLKPPLDEE